MARHAVGRYSNGWYLLTYVLVELLDFVNQCNNMVFLTLIILRDLKEIDMWQCSKAALSKFDFKISKLLTENQHYKVT
jgi:hypothetical protein